MKRLRGQFGCICIFYLCCGQVQADLPMREGLPREDEQVLQFYEEKVWSSVFEDADLTVLTQAKRIDAQRAARDEITFQGVEGRIERLENGSINWQYRGPRNDPEWSWLFNRHRFFRDWYTLYQAEGDPLYLQKLDDTFADWLANNPYPGHLTFSAAWRPLEVARRVLEVWVPLADFWMSDEIAAGTRLAMLASVPEHADSLMNYHSFSGNHLITEMVALGKLALTWPEFADSDQWLDYAIATAADEIFKQTYPDGAYKELANHYQRVVLTSYESFLKVLAVAGREEIYARVQQRVDAMWYYFVSVAKPDGFGPLNSDSDLEYNWGEAKQWLAKAENRDRVAQSARVQWFPYAGHLVVKAERAEAKNWLFWDIGPHGTAHQHEDQLHLSLVGRGEGLLVDAGRYTYQPSALRDYFKGSRGHNVSLWQGRGSWPPPNQVAEELAQVIHQGELGVFAVKQVRFPKADSGVFEGPVGRRALWVPADDEWLILDQWITFEAGELETLWHFHPDNEVQVDEGAVLITTAKGVEWVLEPLEPWLGSVDYYKGLESDTLVAGWYSDDYNKREPAAQVVFAQMIDGPRVLGWRLRLRGSLPVVEYRGYQGDVLSFEKKALDGSARSLIIDLSGPGRIAWSAH